MTFYCSVFENAETVSITRYGPGGPGPEGGVMAATFRLLGQEFIALDGGPQFTFSPAVSFMVVCDTQAEIDHLWEKLGEGGKPNVCGWLDDRFGLTWQIVPGVLGTMLQDKDRERAGRVMRAMMQMAKIDIAGLERARAGE